MPHKDPEVAKAYWLARRKTQDHKDKVRTSVKKRHDADPRFRFDSQLRYNYGIDAGFYDLLYKNQNGKCAICSIHQSELKRRLCVDHSHESGKIRGLLCDECNHGIGKLKDSETLLMNAINYLRLAKKYAKEPEMITLKVGRPKKNALPGGSNND